MKRELDAEWVVPRNILAARFQCAFILPEGRVWEESAGEVPGALVCSSE